MRLLDFLKSQLRAHSWTMTDLARASGMSKQAVSQWMAEEESLRLTPSPQSCRKLAEALGADPDYVLELAGHRQAATQPRAEVDPDLAVVAATWSSLDDGIRRAIRILAGSQPPITGRGRGGITGQSRPGSRDKDGHTRRLTDEKTPQRHLVAAAA